MSIYTDGSVYASNKLGLVNMCLLAIGEKPLPEGTLLEELQAGTDGAIAKDIVPQVLQEVCSRGWFFNTDYNYKFIPDSNGYIVAPPNLLRIDVGRTVNRQNVIIKNNKFYDRTTQSYIFSEPVYADAYWLVDYEDLPVAAYEYIGLRSARKFQQTVIGSTSLAQYTAIDEQEALINMKREHARYQDYNMLSRVVRRNVNPHWYLD